MSGSDVSDTTSADGYHWEPTNAPVASSRTDDIWFADAQRGWAVNSNGHVLHTADGGATWTQQLSAGGAYLRCIGFAGDQVGWVGSLAQNRRLFHTTDGGSTWSDVANLPAGAPLAICGLSVVSEDVVYGSGSNFPDKPAALIKTVDGGASWTAIDLGAQATMLIDVHFSDADHGWVVGGHAGPGVPHPEREDVKPVVLATQDGGQTWTDRLEGIAAELQQGEWGWKIEFVDEQVGFVSLENESAGAVLKTVDGGLTWTRKPVHDAQGNANLEGIGFVDHLLGWTGGWGDPDFSGGFTSETRDGGETWTDANHVGKFLNRFRFIREPALVGYASGDTVYRYTAGPAPAAAASLAGPADPFERASLPLRIRVDAPREARSVRVDVWDRFGRHIATPLHDAPPPGGGEVTWSGETETGDVASPGIYIYRVTAGEHAESRTVLLKG